MEILQFKSNQLHDNDIFSIAHSRLASGFRAHGHAYGEVIVVLEGQADHIIDEHCFRVERGHAFAIGRGSVHSFTNCTADFTIFNITYDDTQFHLPSSELQTLPGYQALFVLEPVRRRHGEQPASLLLDEGELLEVEGLCQKILAEQKSRKAGYRVLQTAAFLEMITYLSRRCDEGRSQPHPFSSVMAYMRSHYHETPTLDTLAHKAHLSKRHFIRLYKEITGFSPGEHMIQMKLDRARQLLESHQEVPIKKMALLLGFCDQNYFARLFKNRFGMSPTIFKEQNNSGKETRWN